MATAAHRNHLLRPVIILSLDHASIILKLYWHLPTLLSRTELHDDATSLYCLEYRYLPLRDIEFFAAKGGVAGICCHRISLVGGFMLSVDGATICGPPVPKGTTAPALLPAAIRMENDTLHVRGLHVPTLQLHV